MKIHTTNLTLTVSSVAGKFQQEPAERKPSLADRAWKLESASQRLQVQRGEPAARIRPPRGRRIYSDSELKTATEMFLKLQEGEDRRPRPIPANPIPGPIDPMDRVADVLLDLMDL